MRALFIWGIAFWAVGSAAESEKAFDYGQFGSEIELQHSSLSNQPVFSVTYSLGATDPDGSTWLISFAAKNALPREGTWNLYRKDVRAYVLGKWQKSIEGRAFQALLEGRDAENTLPHQSHLVLVFKDSSGKFSHLRVGDWCKDQPDLFENMTNGRRCFEVTKKDL